MTDRFIIRNHFESETGVAIQGILHEGEITVLKCGGECWMNILYHADN